MWRLSTSSSDAAEDGARRVAPGRLIRAVRFVVRIRALLVVAAAIGGLDAAFGQFDSFWERFYPSRIDKRALYESLLNGHLAVDTVFIGSSTINMGLDPEVVDRHSGATSLNAGQLGYSPANIAVQVVDEIVASRSVDRIVYAIDTWSLVSDIRDRALVDAHQRGDHFL